MGLRSWRAAYLLLTCLSCRRAPPVGAIVPLQCASETACSDASGRRYVCVTSSSRTGVSMGHAARCRPADCAGCAAVPALSGEVVDSEGERSVLAPGSVVRVWRPEGGAAVEARANAQGRYSVLVAAGSTVLVQAERAGAMNELHAVTMPATGWDVPLDLRSAATVSRLLGAPHDVDASRGLIVVEFTGTDTLAGLGAVSDPPAAATFSFDSDGRVVRGERLSATSRRLMLLAGVVGSARVTLISSPAVRCAVQAGGLARWPVAPGTVTQVDAECTSVAAAP